MSQALTTDCSAVALSPAISKASRNKRSLSSRKHARTSDTDAWSRPFRLFLFALNQDIFCSSLIDLPGKDFRQFSATRAREGNHAKDRADLRIDTCSEGVGTSRDRVEEAEMLKNSKAGSPQIAAMRSR